MFDSLKSSSEILLRGIFAYILFLVLIRISGKRSLAKLNAFDLIVSVALGSVLATTITSDSLAFFDGILTCAVLLILQYIIGKMTNISDKFEDLVKSEPSILFYDNEFNEKILKRERIAKSGVVTAMRQSGIHYFEEVHAVILETNGNISVIKKSDSGKISTLKDLRNKI